MEYKIQIALRTLAATVGAYLTAAASSFAMIVLFYRLGGSVLSDAVYYSAMLTYLVFFILFIASFSMASVKRLYIMLVTLNLVFALVHWLGEIK